MMWFKYKNTHITEEARAKYRKGDIDDEITGFGSNCYDWGYKNGTVDGMIFTILGTVSAVVVYVIKEIYKTKKLEKELKELKETEEKIKNIKDDIERNKANDEFKKQCEKLIAKAKRLTE